jgi:hypothetical protein
MPVDPDHEFVDEPHPSTKTGPNYRYGCWNIKHQLAAKGWKEKPAAKACGHLTALSDPACTGCARRGD